MRRIEEIERAVEELSREELARFREWFAGFDARTWDRELDDDDAAGRLDELAEGALRDHRSGETTEPALRPGE